METVMNQFFHFFSTSLSQTKPSLKKYQHCINTCFGALHCTIKIDSFNGSIESIRLNIEWTNCRVPDQVLIAERSGGEISLLVIWTWLRPQFFIVYTCELKKTILFIDYSAMLHDIKNRQYRCVPLSKGTSSNSLSPFPEDWRPDNRLCLCADHLLWVARQIWQPR